MPTETTFSVAFTGETSGFLEFRILHFGQLVNNFVLNGSSQKSIPLDSGLYLISVKGAATEDGAILTISLPTSPPTPDTFQEGPIYRNYVLNI